MYELEHIYAAYREQHRLTDEEAKIAAKHHDQPRKLAMDLMIQNRDGFMAGFMAAARMLTEVRA